MLHLAEEPVAHCVGRDVLSMLPRIFEGCLLTQINLGDDHGFMYVQMFIHEQAMVHGSIVSIMSLLYCTRAGV